MSLSGFGVSLMLRLCNNLDSVSYFLKELGRISFISSFIYLILFNSGAV